MKKFLDSFVDDTRIGYSIGDPNEITKLQTDLISIFKWADQNKIKFNTDKFECVKYGRNEDLTRLSQ